MTATTQLQTAATNLDTRSVDNETVIDFDIDANTDYEIQSSVVVDEDNNVVEAAVRFGRIEERPDLGLGKPLLASAWTTAVRNATATDSPAIEGDLSDFTHIVPHLRVHRENVEDYDCETLTLDEFASAVEDLATFTSDVLRGDDDTIDQEIDAYL
ncbi:hypothetical protein [Halobacterium salinarum]|uniref:hypothetical protein n=1 Tax=Halobacterium salinarum TaxID=2242 RepID=UPI001F301F5A|nr:hypothetical protein [Halobacterium salinarum]MCF2165428.1 hypothetical protein [Halobacterium salinarum]MCF2168293.1 hypothetical protein [Halobacterium salinarum]